MSREEISKEFQRIKDLLEPSFPLLPSVQPLSPQMDIEIDTTETATETTETAERPKIPTARKSFTAPRSPPTPLAYEPQTPPRSEPEEEEIQEEQPTPQPTPNPFNLSANIQTVSRDLPNFPFNNRQNERFFDTLKKIGLTINNLKDFSLAPSLDDDLFAAFLPQLASRLEPIMATLTAQKLDIFKNLKQISIYLVDHFIFDVFNICKYLLTDHLTKYENNATRMKHLRSIIAINYIANPNNPELVAEYKRRRSTQIHYSAAIREMMHTINHVASLKTNIIYEDPLFDCLDAMKIQLLCAINEIISKSALTEDEKLKDIFINTLM